MWGLLKVGGAFVKLAQAARTGLHAPFMLTDEHVLHATPGRHQPWGDWLMHPTLRPQGGAQAVPEGAG
jgi:hypothetical protein